MRLEPHSRLLYEELRPPEKQRKLFSCQLRIQSENVPPPINRDLHYYGGDVRRQSVQELNLSNKLESLQTNQKKLPDLDPPIEKRSRIEQLKILVRQKDVFPVVHRSFYTD
ncbi:hypothetical protein WN51_04715 [Melipona quadrifasciata]|uniref:Uncharacterized protein n=1 Tax=Melipona quadrifasciata TaxID=166423 RepID=A0A0N0BDE9_9HYME|nr:hypothetical protein WN51_04715 [Melipona quadrifasciata]